MNTRLLVIQQLNNQLKEWQKLSQKYPRPRTGWLKTLRVALGMTADQLAKRLGLKRGRIVQLEKAEIEDTVSLRSLREAANALECDLVYALIPKNQSSLNDIIQNRANQVAKDIVTKVAHSMSLEKQSVSENFLTEQQKMLAQKLIANLKNKKLWKDI